MRNSTNTSGPSRSGRRVGVLTTNDDHLTRLTDSVSDFLLPVSSEVFLHRPIGYLEGRVWIV